MNRRVRFAAPTVPVYVGAWSCYCPACNAIDFNHEHRDRPNFPLIGGSVELPTVAEHNWLIVNAASIGCGSVYPGIKFGYLQEADSLQHAIEAIA